MSTQRFPLPDVGEGLTEAEIVEWKVAVGDTVTVNQVIVEIETAKSLVELPSPWAGTVTALLAEEGTTVDVGIPIIEIGSGAPADAAPAAPSAPVEAVADGGSSDAGSGAVLVGYGTGEAGGARRRRRRGAPAPAQAAPAAPAARPAPAPVPAPTPAPVAAPAPAAPTPAAPEPAPERPALARPMVSVPAADATSGPTSSRARVLAKPPVRKLAKDLGVDLASVHPTGPGSIVTREDVVAHHDAAEPRLLATYPDDDSPWLASGDVSDDGRVTRVPVKSVRKRTAEAMVASAFTAPHVTVFHTVDVTRTMKLVEKLKADRDFSDVRVTPLLIAAKAVLLAVKRHPEINASWDDAAQEIVYKHYVNLGIAAATPRGLVVPNVKDAHRLELLGLAEALGELTATARAGRTTPAAMSDGTFTITNVGVFGIDTGTPILNPGEAGILAFGAIRQQPWVHKGKVKPRWVTQLALSFDHRLVDGGLGSRFLADVARVLEDPAHGLVWG
ncbi:pyruvate dehydrogenase E2 component (dihydrolipoamide acetyltransferase) [Isoptericola jiangsuensis]|uniref:Dihydrolipoamide acetyltransferase component of pyruvate dehydrogenase complex n=1 Tax=Isoptericola jiangsuensis TaxID=548579 RepID=A0A2A9ETW0_9MICO|nr:dihydrolipoamide acetyltransferase family protein [Isoptericola jiangsuensis]PFG41702.1 pyruvate dehydrogenase E2 component (dihydrolipoamide acetyltransferase) [Isoptericola jiangsuensis]